MIIFHRSSLKRAERLLKVCQLKSVKFYFGLSMVRHCPWKMCATPRACIKPGCFARRPLCHKVNQPSCVARWPLCHKVNQPSCEAWRPLCHKVNQPSCVARWPLCHKVNQPSCEAWRPLCHKVNLPRYPTNPPGIELYCHANILFRFGGKTRLLITLVKTLHTKTRVVSTLEKETS